MGLARRQSPLFCFYIFLRHFPYALPTAMAYRPLSAVATQSMFNSTITLLCEDSFPSHPKGKGKE